MKVTSAWNKQRSGGSTWRTLTKTVHVTQDGQKTFCGRTVAVIADDRVPSQHTIGCTVCFRAFVKKSDVRK